MTLFLSYYTVAYEVMTLFLSSFRRLFDIPPRRFRQWFIYYRISMESEVTSELRGWLTIARVSPYDSGNYTCVPSYAVPAWTEVLVAHGNA